MILWNLLNSTATLYVKWNSSCLHKKNRYVSHHSNIQINASHRAKADMIYTIKFSIDKFWWRPNQNNGLESTYKLAHSRAVYIFIRIIYNSSFKITTIIYDCFIYILAFKVQSGVCFFHWKYFCEVNEEIQENK